MSEFLTTLTVMEISDSIFQVADAPFKYKSDLLPGIIEVPVGFQTDFASVPRFMPLVYACLGDTAHEPAVIHDWLYYLGDTTRAKADDILLEAMLAWGVSRWRAYPIYWGVRAGGWVAWNKHRGAGDPGTGRFKHNPNVAVSSEKTATPPTAPPA